MTVRISVSLPDDLHAQIVRMAEASNVSVASVVRQVLSDVVPRMVRVSDFLNAEPPTAENIARVDAWGAALHRLLGESPEVVKRAYPESDKDVPLW